MYCLPRSTVIDQADLDKLICMLFHEIRLNFFVNPSDSSDQTGVNACSTHDHLYLQLVAPF